MLNLFFLVISHYLKQKIHFFNFFENTEKIQLQMKNSSQVVFEENSYSALFLPSLTYNSNKRKAVVLKH